MLSGLSNDTLNIRCTLFVGVFAVVVGREINLFFYYYSNYI